MLENMDSIDKRKFKDNFKKLLHELKTNSENFEINSKIDAFEKKLDGAKSMEDMEDIIKIIDDELISLKENTHIEQVIEVLKDEYEKIKEDIVSTKKKVDPPNNMGSINKEKRLQEKANLGRKKARNEISDIVKYIANSNLGIFSYLAKKLIELDK